MRLKPKSFMPLLARPSIWSKVHIRLCSQHSLQDSLSTAFLGKPNMHTLPTKFLTRVPFSDPQRNLRRDKDRRNMLQFNLQTLPKSAKQKER